MNGFELSIINLELPIFNLKLIYDKLEIVIFNWKLLLLVVFLYFPKQTYPMLVDTSFLKFISCCTFNVLWGNDDTIEIAFSYIVFQILLLIPGKLLINNCQLSIVIPQFSIVISQLLIVHQQSSIVHCCLWTFKIVNHKLLIINLQWTIFYLKLSIIHP